MARLPQGKELSMVDFQMREAVGGQAAAGLYAWTVRAGWLHISLSGQFSLLWKRTKINT